MDIVFLRTDKGRDRPRERGPFVIALGQRLWQRRDHLHQRRTDCTRNGRG